jgi:BirA family biotin operon repressor/biotin-[acetyl-CoA-carboxylase] ligase
MTSAARCRYNARMMNTPSAERIAALCRPDAHRVELRVVEETGSTNADLMAALPGLSAPLLLLAQNQTAGRGRAGREWLSVPGKSLTFSLAWKFGLPVHALVGLPLAVGVALAETLAAFGIEVRLKWPNDVLLQGRKLAGILIESAHAVDGSWAVIGIGINMVLDAAAARIGQPVASLPWLAELDRDVLMAALLSALAEALTLFERHGLSAFLQRWNGLHAYRGQTVMILDQGRLLHEGIAAGADALGRFLLDTAGGQVAVMAGDVSLRPKE